MNEFDQFVKHELHVKNYARYTDDFAIVSSDREYLEALIDPMSRFLNDHLALALHPRKILIRRLHQGVDFLGYNIFPNHRLLRAKTRRRIFEKFRGKIMAYRAGNLSKESLSSALQSYLGVMSHANATQLTQELKNLIWFAD